MEVRPVAAGVAGGSVASVVSSLLWLLDRSGPAIAPPFLPDCPVVDPKLLGGLDPRSLAIGILIGVASGPILDILCVLRHNWRLWVRARLGLLGQSARSGSLYRVLSLQDMCPA